MSTSKIEQPSSWMAYSVPPLLVPGGFHALAVHDSPPTGVSIARFCGRHAARPAAGSSLRDRPAGADQLRPARFPRRAAACRRRCLALKRRNSSSPSSSHLGFAGGYYTGRARQRRLLHHGGGMGAVELGVRRSKWAWAATRLRRLANRSLMKRPLAFFVASPPPTPASARPGLGPQLVT